VSDVGDGGGFPPPPGFPTAPYEGVGPAKPDRPVWLIPVAVVAALLLVVIVVFIATSGGKKDATAVKTDGGTGEIFLQPAAANGPDPFTESAAVAAPASTVPASTPVTLGKGNPPPTAPVFPAIAGGTGQVSSVYGGAPGLYGGTRNQQSCNKQRIVEFLAANPSKARAWADAQGIGVNDIASFIAGLTPVLLRSDTRVTNHGYRNGIATAHQDVLQAGTAVLIDQYGVPRARCACGNPLLPPQPVATAPVYQGTPWSGFSPASLTVINRNTTVINVITIIDVSNGQPFGRPLGPGGGGDLPLPAQTTTVPPASTAPTLPGTAPQASEPFGTFPPGTSPPPATAPPGTFPPATSPPVTAAPPTAPPTTLPAIYRLVSATHTVSELASSWTVDDRAGTATIDLGGSGRATYTWSVPQEISPGGASISWGGSTSPPGSNINVSIAARGDGLTFDTSDLTVDVTGTSGRKSATIRVSPGATTVTLSYSMGFSVNAIYTYRR